MEKKKRIQRFLSLFLACILMVHTPVSVLASDVGFGTNAAAVFGDGTGTAGEVTETAPGSIVPETGLETSGEMVPGTEETILGETVPETGEEGLPETEGNSSEEVFLQAEEVFSDASEPSLFGDGSAEFGEEAEFSDEQTEEVFSSEETTDENKTDFNISEGNVEITKDGAYTVTGSTTSSNITVADGVKATITLKNVNIQLSGGRGNWDLSDPTQMGKPAIALGAGAEATIRLAGTNNVKSGEGRAGIEVPGSRVHKDGATVEAVPATLTIEGEGSLSAQAGNSGAGIGGSLFMDAGNIIINGGNITAKGTSGDGGSGIGGGHSGKGDTYGSFKSITINGGVVNASGPWTCSGIGLGSHATARGAVINITGGVVTATAGDYGDKPDDIGKGHGNGSEAPVITISGNAVVIAKRNGINKKIGGTVNKNGGIIIEKNAASMHGSVTLSDSLTIPSGTTLTIPEGAVLVVPTDVILTVDGTIDGKGNVKTLGGSIVNEENIKTETATDKFTYKLTLAAEPAEQKYNEQITLTATVKKETDDSVAADITGMVTFSCAGRELGTAELTDGVASITCKADMEAGTYSMKAALTVNEVGIAGRTALIVAKADQTTAPAAPEKTTEVTINSVALEAVTGEGVGEIQYGYAEKPAEGEAAAPDKWQSGTTFTNLWPNTTYIFYSRFAGDGCYNPINSVNGLEVTTTALPELSAPVLSETPVSDTMRSIVLTAPEACKESDQAFLQYSMSSDGGETWGSWQTDTKFSKLGDDKDYQFRARYAITKYSHFSPESNVVTIRSKGIIIPEVNYNIVTGDDTSGMNANCVRFSNMNISGVKVLKHSYDVENNKAIVLLDADTDKTAPINFVIDCFAKGSRDIASAQVKVRNYYSAGQFYANEGSKTEGKWVYTMTPDTTGLANSRPYEYFKWDENGRASIDFYPQNGSTTGMRVYTVEFWIAGTENTAPSLRPEVSAEASHNMVLGETYGVRLGKIFEDNELDEMTYTVSVNGAEAVEANAVYHTFTPTENGEYTLVFRAKDSNGAESETYTVKVGAYQVTALETGATKYDSWNLNMTKISVGKAKIEKVIESGSDDLLAYFILDKDTDKDAPVFLNINILAGANRFNRMFINEKEVSGSIDSKVSNPVWKGLYTPQWNEQGEATLTLQASCYNYVYGSYKYTIKLKIANAENQAPVLSGAAESSAETTQYDAYTVDAASLFTDTDDTYLKYFVSVNDGEAKEVPASYAYVVPTAGTHTLKFTAKDLAGAESDAYILTLNAAEYVCPEGSYLIGNTSEDGALIRMTVLNNSDQEIEGVTYETEEGANGEHIIHVSLPGEMKHNDRVKAKFYMVQDSEQVPFIATDSRNDFWALDSRTDTITTRLTNAAGTAAAYWYESVPTEEINVYETYQIRYQIVRPDNQAPTLVEGVSSLTDIQIKQYETWKVDLANIFKDPEGDSLTYTVFATGEESKEISNSYTYEADTAGSKVLIFMAADCFGAISGTYMVRLSVEHVPSTGVETGDYGVLNINGEEIRIGTITDLYVRGQEIDHYHYTKYEDNTRSIAVLLDSSVADDAQLKIAYKTTDTYAPGVKITPSADVQLVDGAAKVTVQSTGHTYHKTTYTYDIYLTKEENTLPELAADVTNPDSAELVLGNAYTVDLSTIFADADGDELYYKVCVDDGQASFTEAAYSYIPDKTGTYTLKFTALDLWGESEEYVVALKATNSDVTYDVNVKVPDSVIPAFYANIGIDENGQDILGDELTAEKGSSENGFTVYTVKVPENIARISFRGTDAEENSWGGMSAAVQKDMDTIVLRQLQAVISSKIAVDNKMVTPTAEQAVFQIKENTEGSYAVSGGTYEDEDGYLGYRYLLLAADNALTYTYYIKALGEFADAYGINQGDYKTVNTDSAEVVTAAMPLAAKRSFAITAPKDALVEMFSQQGYYNVVVVPSVETIENEDNTKTVVFNTGMVSGSTMFRVSMEGKITKAGYVAANATEITVDWENDDRTPSYSRPYENKTAYGARGDDSMYVNVNYRNNLLLNAGETFNLKAYRIWEIINSDTMNIMIEPDFHYNVISGSDVISVTPTEGCTGNAKNNWLDIKALKNGTAVLEISYDAIDIVSGNVQTSGAVEGISEFTFNASDPARNALIVVQVGGNSTDIDFGIRSNAGGVWDAEHDTFYFSGNSAQLEMKPAVTSGSVAKVEVSGNKGASWTTLTAEADTYFADIVPGNNIIRITKADGAVSYQLVRGDKVTYTISEIAGYSDGDGIIEAGEQIQVKINGVHNTIGKMSGIYNPNDYRTWFTFNGEETYGSGGQYTYPKAAYVNIIIPGEAENGDIFKLTNGYTTNGGWGSSGGAHRGITGEVPPGLDSGNISGGYNIFEDIVITVGSEVGTAETPDQPDNPENPDNPDVPEDSEDPEQPVLEFDIAEQEIKGYVTVSFEDYAIRQENDLDDMETAYKKPLGTIVGATRVPYKAYDTIASVTLRLLKALDMTEAHTGNENSGFYLSFIGNFSAGGTKYSSFGEFDAGPDSGWMITQNNWFINRGASEFYVADGDLIKWQYTCQQGADIGCDRENPSAEITALTFKERYGVLSPVFDKEVTDYIYTVPEEVSSIALEVTQENYWAQTVYKVNGKTYKPMAEIPVEDGTEIVIDCTYAESAGAAASDTDSIKITIRKDDSAAEELQKAAAVEAAVAALPAVNELKVEDQEAVKAAREAYEALTDVQKALVSKETLKQLEAAEAKIAELSHTHTWDEGTVTKEATCKETGVKTFTCSCGEIKTESIPESSHQFSSWKTASKATVFKAEVQKRTCTVCKETESRTYGKALKAVLELPGKLKSFYLQKGNSVKFAVTMARGDSIASVKSSKTAYLKVSGVSKKSGQITLKGVKTGTSNLTITLASGKTRTYKVQVTNGTVKTKKLTVNNVNDSQLTLAKGKTFVLEAVKAPFSSSQKITYQTSDKKIVSVSSTGELKALKAGKAVITVTSGSKKVKVTVTVPGITNVKTKVTVKVNKTLALKPKTYGLSGKVTYTSSDKSVAKVSSKGKITGVAPGKAVITVSRGGQKVKTTVTVPGITNVKSAVTVKKNKTLTLKPELYGISGSVTYQTSNKKIATVTSKGKIKGIKKGTAKITVKAGDFTKTVTVTVK